MPVGTIGYGDGRDILKLIDDYGIAARKAGRSERMLRSFDIIREAINSAAERKHRRQEEERARQDRQRETEESRKYEQTEYDRRRLVQRGEALSDAERKSREEQEQQQALAEANAPKVQQFHQLFRQAIENTDRNAYFDALDLYGSLDENYQSRLKDVLSEYKDQFKEVTKPKEEKTLSPSEELAAMELQALKNLQDLKRRQREGDKSVTDDMIGDAMLELQMLDKSARDKLFEAGISGAGQPEMPETTTGPQRTAYEKSTFGNDSRKSLTPAGLGLQRGAELFGVPEFEADVEKFGEPFISPAAASLQKDFLEAEISDAAIDKGMFPDTPQGRAMAKAYARAKLGKPDAIERVLNGDVQSEDEIPAVTEEEIQQLETEIRQRYPDLDTLLQNDEFREALDDEYQIHGLSDFLSMNKMSYDAGL